MIDTPETDAEWNRIAYYNHPYFEQAIADFARKLERERDEARHILKPGGMLDIIDRAQRETAKAREHQVRLSEALEYCLNIIGHPDNGPDWWSDLDCDKAWNDGQAALAAVKGEIK